METATVETTTPVTTTEAAPAAPATSAPASPSPTSERPSSMLEALEQAAARADASEAAKTETAATAPPATPESTGSHPTDTKGPIPFDVHKPALDNARTKAAHEAVAQFREKYGWAEQVQPETLSAWVALSQRMTSDPVGYLRDFHAELARHPVYGPQLRSEAGRLLAGPKPVDLTPDVQIVDANGRVSGMTFSAERVQAIVQQAVADAIGKEVDPLKRDAQVRAQAEARARQDAETQAFHQQTEAKADEVMAELNDILEGAVERKDMTVLGAVNELMVQHPEWSAHKAALEVRKTRLKATLDADADKRAVERLKQKAAGTTTPGTGTGAPPKRPTTAAELAAWMEAHA